MSYALVRSGDNRVRIQVYEDSTAGGVANEAAWVFALDDDGTYTLRTEEGEVLGPDDVIADEDGTFRLVVVE